MAGFYNDDPVQAAVDAEEELATAAREAAQAAQAAAESSEAAAAASETAAAASAASASTSASSASTSATNAAISAATASSAETAAGNYSTSAGDSAVSAAASADSATAAAAAASSSKSAAAASAAAAAVSESNAAGSAASASSSESSAADSATAASGSASAAASSAAAASASETAAQNSSIAAGNNAILAINSATAAAASESAAASSASSASTSATNAASSASSAGAAATNAAISEAGAAASGTAAASSETAAALSATDAASSAASAASSEAAASTSAASASSSELSASTSATNAAASETAAAASQAAAATSQSAAAASQTASATSASNASGSEAGALSARTSAEAARDEAEAHKNNAYTYAQSAASAVAYQDLTAIAASKADTAVDVFVYDTSRDSDGGAWRHRTQHTSWYNETLNTATRGSRREFPAVAVIVAESNKVTIYDGDDPSLPMWMVFNRRSTSSAAGFMSRESVSDVISGYLYKISAINGYLGIAAVRGLDIVNFPVDTLSRYSPDAYASGGVEFGITNRDNSASYFSATLPSINSGDSRVDTVHLRLSNSASVNEAGLPIPHAFVGAETARVFDLYTEAESGNLGDRIIAVNEDGTAFIESRDEDSTFATSTGGFSFAATGSGGNSNSSFKYNGTLDNPVYSSAFSDSNSQNPDVNWNKSGTLSRVVLDPVNINNSVWCQATTTYNTGWMTTLTKGAFLSDTDDTDVTGSELVTNGDFATNDLTGWTDRSIGTGSVDASTGAAALVGTNASNRGRIEQAVSVTAGKLYRVTFDVVRTSGALGTGFTTSSGQTPISTYEPSSGSKEYFLVAPSGAQYFAVTTHAGGGDATIDNISIRLAEPDRSVNRNSLIVNGTITKDPVATGADLVAYSGFSAANYLEQPYNSDLDFGTGDFCIMGWGRTNINGTFLSRGDGISAGSWYWRHTGGSTSPFYIHDGTAFRLALNVPLPQGNRVHFALLRRSGTVFLYGNGELMGSLSGTYPALSMTNLTAKLRIGEQQHTTYSSAAESLALLRISATAPTAEQIAKIYEDEKVLFQEGAQATLYGSSDAVTALAHDPVTDLLHVGTSAGRSVFQGLRRVDNTTDAVGTAISAVDSLVVEE